MKSPIRYSKSNGAIHIGGAYNKITIFTLEKCARITIGRLVIHIGKYWNQ